MQTITLANYGIGDRDCSSYDYRLGIPAHWDPHGLDGDDDGVGCEDLPTAPDDDFDDDRPLPRGLGG